MPRIPPVRRHPIFSARAIMSRDIVPAIRFFNTAPIR
jgi:hypothetical protein